MSSNLIHLADCEDLGKLAELSDRADLDEDARSSDKGIYSDTDSLAFCAEEDDNWIGDDDNDGSNKDNATSSSTNNANDKDCRAYSSDDVVILDDVIDSSISEDVIGSSIEDDFQNISEREDEDYEVDNPTTTTALDLERNEDECADLKQIEVDVVANDDAASDGIGVDKK
mmetsp:Transcript_31477/g.68004  ORF Transcript_31477/g.68004 Transcript_31477/m.68004 type:complete len:171 (+) Transcript_31477:125-637(+)